MSDSPGGGQALAARRAEGSSRTELVVRLFRVFSLGATVTYPIVGAATARPGVGLGLTIALVVLGVGFHVYADVGNDVMDLPLDRRNPRRAPWPLVQGDVRPPTALAVAFLPLPVLYALVGRLDGSAAVTALSAAILLIGAYNVAGKALPVPLLADVVQGLGWASLVWLGAEAAGGPTPATWWAAAFVVAYIALVNGVHGAVRDLEHDASGGASTTALLLGASLEDGALRLSRTLVVHGSLLQAALVLLTVGPVVTGALGYPPPVRAATLMAVLLLNGAATAWLVVAWRGRRVRRIWMRAGTRHLFLAPAALLAAHLGRISPTAAALAVLAFAAPPWLFSRWAGPGRPLPAPPGELALRDSRGRIATLRGLVRMSRPYVWGAAAALCWMGAASGGVDGERVSWAMLAAALVVAAANVFNDRCDLEADRINRPARPLPAGRVTPNAADRFVLGAGASACGAAGVLGAWEGGLAGVLLVLGLAYSVWLRERPWLGVVTVASLFGAALLYGRFASLGPPRLLGWGAAQVWLFVATREVLKGIGDQVGDRAAGYDTPAVRLSVRSAVWMVRGGMAVLALLLVIPILTGWTGPAYFWAVSAGGLLPLAMVARELRPPFGMPALRKAEALSSLVFLTGAPALLLLVTG